jgi:hypothetical protein
MMLTELIKRLFSNMSPKSEASISKSKQIREKTNRRMDALLATLNGEDKWFFCQDKGDKNDNSLVR